MRNSGQSEQGEAGRGAVRAPEFLIANLELEFQLTPIRISNVRFSNRKFLAIFSPKLVGDGEPRAALLQPTASSFQPPETLAAVAANRYTAIRILRNSHKTKLKSKF